MAGSGMYFRTGSLLHDSATPVAPLAARVERFPARRHMSLGQLTPASRTPWLPSTLSRSGVAGTLLDSQGLGGRIDTLIILGAKKWGTTPTRSANRASPCSMTVSPIPNQRVPSH